MEINQVFSQGKEQKEILKFFGDRSKDIIFLDIGANSKILSNTYALALSGAKGVCVEASPEAFKHLNEDHLLHNNVVCFNVAIGNYNGKAELYESGNHLGLGDVSLLSTLHEKETNRWGGPSQFRKITVDVIDFKRLMELSPYRKFQMVSIDIEGSDFILLEQMDLKELGCELIVVEHNSDLALLEKIKEYCRQFGLVNELLRNAENIILSI